MSLPLAVLLLLFQDPSQDQPTTEEKEIVVTAKRYESELLETPGGVTVLRREDFEHSTARTVVDLLQGRPGLFVTKNSSTPQDSIVDARGFNNGGGNGQRLLVLVDGRKVNSVTGSHVDWAMIPLEYVERIEIVRGPAAALYGDTAVAGVLHIITRRPTKEPEADLAAGFGSFRTFQSHGAYRFTEGPVGLSLFAGRVTSDGFRRNSGFNGENAMALATYEICPTARAWLKLGFHDDHRERPGTLTKDEIRQLGPRSSMTLGDEADVRQGTIDLGSEWELLGATYTPAAFLTQDASDSVTTFSSGQTATDSESRILQFTLRRLMKFDAGPVPVTFVAGADASLETADADTLNDFPAFAFVQRQDSEYDRRLWGLYARVEARPFASLIAAAGVRYDGARIEFKRTTTDLVGPGGTSALEGDEDFSTVAPVASLGWLVTERTSIYVSAGRTLRYPNRDELVGFLTASLDLDPERGRVYEAGVRTSEWAPLSGGFSVYWMVVRDEIFFVPPPVGEDVFTTGNFGQNENVDRVLHRGVEIELESRAVEGLVVRASATVQRTTVESGPFDGKEMPITPNVTASASAVWMAPFGLSIAAEFRYVGERFLLNDLSNDVDPLPDYAIVNARIAYTWEKATVFFEANNLLGREYLDNGGIGAGSTGIWGDRQAFNPAPDENFLAGVSVTF